MVCTQNTGRKMGCTQSSIKSNREKLKQKPEGTFNILISTKRR